MVRNAEGAIFSGTCVATATATQDLGCIAHDNAGSLTHWVRLGIEPLSSWMLVGFTNCWPMMGTPIFDFLECNFKRYCIFVFLFKYFIVSIQKCNWFVNVNLISFYFTEYVEYWSRILITFASLISLSTFSLHSTFYLLTNEAFKSSFLCLFLGRY